MVVLFGLGCWVVDWIWTSGWFAVGCVRYFGCCHGFADVAIICYLLLGGLD